MDRMDCRPEKSDNTNIPRDRMACQNWMEHHRQEAKGGLIRIYSKFDQGRSGARQWARCPHVRRLGSSISGINVVKTGRSFKLLGLR